MLRTVYNVNSVMLSLFKTVVKNIFTLIDLQHSNLTYLQHFLKAEVGALDKLVFFFYFLLVTQDKSDWIKISNGDQNLCIPCFAFLRSTTNSSQRKLSTAYIWDLILLVTPYFMTK